MNFIGNFFSNFKVAYSEINGATLTGAIDAVVVRQPDGSFLSSPFHVRFGKIGVLRSREKVVDIEINGEPVDIRMKLGDTGEAFFVEEIADDDETPYIGTSPLPRELELEMRANIEVEAGAADGENQLVSRGVFTYRGEEKASSPAVDVPRTGSWQDFAPTRSKSLTGPAPFFIDEHASNTDMDENDTGSTRTMRRRRRKRASSALSKRISGQPRSSSSSDASALTVAEVSDGSSAGENSTIVVSKVENATAVQILSDDTIFQMDDVEDTREEASQEDYVALEAEAKNWASKPSFSLGPDFHPFSDTDISPPPSPSRSWSASAVKSDTEFECPVKKKSSFRSAATLDEDDEDRWSWTWGELPTPPSPAVRERTEAAAEAQAATDVKHDATVDTPKGRTAQQDASNRSMLGSMLSFMRATKNVRHKPSIEGIYLDDLNSDELDPEVAALYFPPSGRSPSYAGFRAVKDEDAESGNGTSLPQSPHSVEGAIGGAKLASIDSDFEDTNRHPVFHFRGHHDLAFSLCGTLDEHNDAVMPETLFLQSLVTYDDFCEDPKSIIGSPNLVVRLDGKYMTWNAAAPQILSLVLFERPLPQRVVEKLCEEHETKKEPVRTRKESKGYSWFSWGRQDGQQPLQPLQQPSKLVSSASVDSVGGLVALASVSSPAEAPLTPTVIGNELSKPSPILSMDNSEEANAIIDNASATVFENYESSESDCGEAQNGKRYKKTIRLSNNLINKLNLQNGSNSVVFSVTTAYQGTTSCKCHVFLWNYDDKIVVSDIDGTITKSDVLGHIMPIIGRDWAQGGVAQLFTNIRNNGYNFLYLSSRAIGQARITREYLRSIKQGDVSLPDGPVLLNPTSLISAFHREVIEKKPELFKISCLRDIKALFPPDHNPFYAGYGNRINDVWAYSAVGIPIQRIFTINHRGELKHELTQTFQSTYSNLVSLVNTMFPSARERETHHEFSSLQFWKDPLPSLPNEEIQQALQQV